MQCLITSATPSQGASAVRRTLSTVLLTLSSLVTVPASANVMITGLLIDSTPYDVTFHDDPASFQSLWDANGDWTFGDGSLGHEPTFWGDRSGAEAAADAIIAYLGLSGVALHGGDSFLVPYDYDPAATSWQVWVTTDWDSAPAVDDRGINNGLMDSQISNFAAVGYPWVSFDRAVVPAPVTPTLLLAGLIAAGAARRLRRAD